MLGGVVVERNRVAWPYWPWGRGRIINQNAKCIGGGG
jgi:hypothetical protein